MLVKSRYSKSFQSDLLTQHKYDELKNLAALLLNTRNEISLIVNKNALQYLDYSKHQFQSMMLPTIKHKVHSNFTKQLCDDVFVAYENRFEHIKDKMRFEVVTAIKFEYYKRNTKNKKKGAYKGQRKTTVSTPLSKVLSYLARYGNENTVAYITQQMGTDTKKASFYQSVLDKINKFGFERLLNIANMRRDNIVRRYPNPIEFKILTFRGRSRLSKDIVSVNHNKKSIRKAFIEIGWVNRNQTLVIPVKYSYAWHGRKLAKYTNGTDTSFTICFLEKLKEVRIILSYEDSRYYPDVNADTDNYVGYDVNSKHSQITGSNGIVVDHHRKALEQLVKELQYIDDLKAKDKEYKIGKKRQYKIDALRRVVLNHTRNNCADICKQMNSRNENHAVFENLNKSFGKCHAKTKEVFNFNRLHTEMKLSSIKDEFDHIARKYNIVTSFIHPEYTSQECRMCGFIDDGNRVNQEDFMCLECGHKDNADSNASHIIGERVSEAVQRNLLDANKTVNGAFRPKPLHRYKVREQLLTFRHTRPKNLDGFKGSVA